MPTNYFSPRPGKFGTARFVVNREAGANPLTNSTTTNFYITLPPTISGRISGLGVFASTLAASAGGTVLLTFSKVSGTTGGTTTALNTAVSIETTTAVAKVVQKVDILSTLTEAERRVTDGNCILAAVAATSTYDTQPVDLTFIVELELLK